MELPAVLHVSPVRRDVICVVSMVWCAGIMQVSRASSFEVDGSRPPPISWTALSEEVQHQHSPVQRNHLSSPHTRIGSQHIERSLTPSLQPNPQTQAHQLNLWSTLILSWARHTRTWSVNVDAKEGDLGEVFWNRGIRRESQIQSCSCEMVWNKHTSGSGRDDGVLRMRRGVASCCLLSTKGS